MTQNLKQKDKNNKMQKYTRWKASKSYTFTDDQSKRVKYLYQKTKKILDC